MSLIKAALFMGACYLIFLFWKKTQMNILVKIISTFFLTIVILFILSMINVAVFQPYQEEIRERSTDKILNDLNPMKG